VSELQLYPVLDRVAPDGIAEPDRRGERASISPPPGIADVIPGLAAIRAQGAVE
jgi:hypothetical protein